MIFKSQNYLLRYFFPTENRDRETPKNPASPLGSQPKTRTEMPIQKCYKNVTFYRRTRKYLYTPIREEQFSLKKPL